MTKPNVSKVIRDIRIGLSKRSPEILTGIGIAGMITTTVLAVRATPKALQLIEEREREIELNSDGESFENLNQLDKVKIAWKCYIPAAVTCGVSIACLIGANSVNAKRNAALAAAYTLSDTALREYRDKVVETIGEKKEQAIRDKVSEEHVKKTPLDRQSIILTDKGDTLCLEPLSGRYFKTNIDKIKKAENDINKRILTDPFNAGASLNEFYDEVGLPHTDLGETLGWNLDIGLIDIHLSAQIAGDETDYEGTPCIVINYTNPPKYNF